MKSYLEAEATVTWHAARNGGYHTPLLTYVQRSSVVCIYSKISVIDDSPTSDQPVLDDPSFGRPDLAVSPWRPGAELEGSLVKLPFSSRSLRAYEAID